MSGLRGGTKPGWDSLGFAGLQEITKMSEMRAKFWHNILRGSFFHTNPSILKKSVQCYWKELMLKLAQYFDHLIREKSGLNWKRP